MSHWTEERLRAAAYHYLGRYASNRARLADVLRRKILRGRDRSDLTPDEQTLLAAVVDRCEALGLIDEAGYAAARAETLRRRGKGRRAVAADLAARGTERAVVDQVLAEEPPDAERLAALRLARRKRLGPFGNAPALDDPQAHRRALGMFARAGISLDLALEVLAMAPDAAEQALAGLDQSALWPDSSAR